MRKFLLLPALFTLMALTAFGRAPAAAAPVEQFELKVKFGDGPELVLLVTPDIPFTKQVKGEKGGFFAISGVVLPSVGDSYPVVLTTFEWFSETSNIISIDKGNYTLGKSVSGGGSGSMPKTVTLTRANGNK